MQAFFKRCTQAILSHCPLPTPATTPLCSAMSQELRIRKFSRRKQRWVHTTNGRSKLRNQGAQTDNEDDTGSSGASGSSSPTTPTDPSAPLVLPSSFRIVTWNISFDTPNERTRMITALDHLRDEILRCPDGQPHPRCVILLQEANPTSLQALLEHSWVREHFLIAPVKSSAWPMSAYGNATLVSRDIPVTSAQLVDFGPYDSVMGRHALIVDLRLHTQPKPGDQTGEEPPSPREVTVRIANVHLESLPMGVSFRPLQLKTTARLLRGNGIYAGIVAGDMNAIMPNDADIHQDALLLDAWPDGDEDESGFTWGYQPRSKFPSGRLDKILYTSKQRCEVERPQRVGVGLKTRAKHWVSDHYGLVTTVRLVG